MTFSKKQLILSSLLGATALSLNFLFLKNVFIGSTLLCAYIFLLSNWIGKSYFSSQDNAMRSFFGGLALLFSLMTVLTGIYYVFGITATTTVIVLVIVPLLLTVLPFRAVEQRRFIDAFHIKSIKPLAIAAILLNVAILVILFGNRTEELLPSPWTALPTWFFALYAVAAGTTIYAALTSASTSFSIAITSLFFFASYSVVPLMYPLGFGFDALIHRATETWIQLHGFIDPKQPFYIGQYSLVVWLSNLSAIPIYYIDVYLVPVLAAITIPATISYSLKSAWSVPMRIGSVLSLFILFPFFLALYLTTPHNVLILFHILTVFLVLAYTRNALPFYLLLLAGLAGLVTHPLIGVPVFLFILAAWSLKKVEGKTALVYTGLAAYAIATVISTPLMFSINLLLNNYDLPTLTNPLKHIGHVLILFKRPFWYEQNAPILWELFYAWQWLITPITIAIGALGLFIKKDQKITRLLYLTAFLSFIASGFLLRSWIVFPNVSSFEQGNYPMRLFTTSIIFLLPWGMYSLYAIWKRVSTTSKWSRISLCTIVATSVILTFSFYLSYPQRNPKVYFPGFNVTKHDFEAVEWIHKQNDEHNYIVLANILTSVSALAKYGFISHFDTPKEEVFYYSIPSGGPLYLLYERMLYEGQKREFMNEALALTGAERGYFVVSSYWANYKNIVEGAKKTADGWHTIGEDNIYIFFYERDSTE